MAWVGLDIRMDLDDTKAQALIGGILVRGKDPRPVFNRIIVDLQRSAADTFRAQGRPTPWKPLSPVTIARRRKGGKGQGAIGGSMMILQDTGALRESLTGRARGSVRRVGRVDIDFGTNLDYGPAHQWGRAAIPNVTQQVKAHRRKSCVRHIRIGYGTIQEMGLGSIYGVTRQRKIGPHMVRAHSRIVTLPAIPRRTFLLWQNQDVEDAIDHLLRYMLWGY